MITQRYVCRQLVFEHRTESQEVEAKVQLPSLAGRGFHMLMEFSDPVNFSECDGKIRETPCCCCSVIRLCLTHYDLMDCRTADFPVLHHLPELVQTHIHWVSDAHPAISFSAIPFSLYLHYFPASGSFCNESALPIRWPKDWNFSFNISPSKNTQDWSPLGWTGWISLQSKGLSRVFSNTTVQKH